MQDTSIELDCQGCLFATNHRTWPCVLSEIFEDRGRCRGGCKARKDLKLKEGQNVQLEGHDSYVDLSFNLSKMLILIMHCR
jgi:hypothetical protein